MSDFENNNPNWTETQSSAASEPAGFCQDCGKPLTRETARPVGSGVFCEPCLQTRLSGGAPAGYTGAPTGTVPPAGYGPVVPPAAGEPSPFLAGLLGFIPGVGAMYNGQFAKGIAHIAIFTVIMSLADHVSDLFGIFVAGWVFYQVFDAIHTARARRDGTPLPNAFGLNDIGDRMGFGKNWPGSHARPMATHAPTSAWAPGAAQAPPAGTAAATDWATVPPVPPVAPQPPANWAGYVPPQHFGQAYAAPVADAQAAAKDASARYAGYESVYHAPPVGSVVPPPVAPVSRFPAGAIWLIGLGAFFLATNFAHDWRVRDEWFPVFLFFTLAVYGFFKRVTQPSRYTGLSVMRFPLIMLILGVIFLLNALNVATLGQLWPLGLILLGVFALLDRAGALAGFQHGQQPVAAPTTFVPTTVAAGAESHELAPRDAEQEGR